ncbi:hypothetical protein GCM10009830_09780 [Glycomyces endophyticus]|uniref:Integral membrane protein n=1 Tax=Glycomyces endophyticus TaxID=480996 RepID=A0ABP4S9R7_9ACTN
MEVPVSETPSETPSEAAEAAGPQEEREGGGIGRLVRWIVAMLACVLAVVAVTGAVAAYYARLELLTTDQFVERTQPIAEDEQVQAAVAQMITAKIEESLDVDAIASRAAGWVGVENPPAYIRDLVASAAETLRAYIETEVNEFVASPQFVTVWDAAVTEAHSSLVSALEGENAGSLTAEGTTLTLDLGKVVEVVKKRLAENDFAYASDIPAVEAQYVLLDSEQVPELQERTGQLRWAATWLPWIALALLVVAVVVAPRRWVAALVVGVLAAVLAGVALVALSAAREEFIAQAGDASFAPLTYDAFTSGLKAAYLVMLVAALVVAVAAVVALLLRRRRAEPEPEPAALTARARARARGVNRARSRPRLAAATTARLTVSSTPPVRRTSSAAAVVPPGVVTPSRSSAAGSSLACRLRQAPRSIWSTMTRAAAGSMPPSTAAPVIASARKYRKAGPEPPTAVMRSMRDSSTATVTPTRSNRSSTSVRSVPSAAASAVAASRERAATFVMARTAVTPSGRRSAMAFSVTPAARETTTASGSRAGAISSRSPGTTPGRTATSTRSASETAPALSVPTSIP